MVLKKKTLFNLLSNFIDNSDSKNDYSTRNEKNLFSTPYSTSIYQMCLNSLFDYDDGDDYDELTFHFNVIDNVNGEMITFDLICNNDLLSLKLILKKYVQEKGNKQGLSPLYLATQNFIENSRNNSYSDEDKDSSI